MNQNASPRRWRARLPPIAGILLIVGAGGGFKQVLIDTGIGDVITKAVIGSGLSVLFLAWVVAALVRVATGSATVATVTAAGLLAPVAATLADDRSRPDGAGHRVAARSSSPTSTTPASGWSSSTSARPPQTFKTWTVLECLISVVGLIGVLLLSLFV